MRVSTKKIRYDDRLGSLLNLNDRTKKDLQLQSSKRITPAINEEHGKEDDMAIQKDQHARPQNIVKNIDAQAGARADAQIVGQSSRNM